MATSTTSKQSSKEAVLMLLSDAETGQVSAAEGKPALHAGEPYVDLDNLAAGVQTAGDGIVPVANIIPRSAVTPATWERIVTKLKAR